MERCGICPPLAELTSSVSAYFDSDKTHCKNNIVSAKELINP